MLKIILILFLGFIIGPILIVIGFNMMINSQTNFKTWIGASMFLVGFIIIFIAVVFYKCCKFVITF